MCRFIFCSNFLRLSSRKVETNKQGHRAMLHGGRSLQDVQVVRGPAGRQRRLICLLPQLRCSRMAFWTHQSPYRARATALMTQKRNAGGLYERTVDSLIPRSRREKRWFFFTSFAAGLCEEIIFRGFFLYLLGRAFPAAPWFLLAAAAGFMFCVAHF